MNVLLVGCGRQGQEHLESLLSMPGIARIGVHDERPAAANALPERERIVFSTTLADLLRELVPTVAIVATPGFGRFPLVRELCRFGVPCLILEKPLAETLEEARNIAEVIEKTATACFINYSNRFGAGDLVVHALLQSPLMGELDFGEARLHNNIYVTGAYWAERAAAWRRRSSPISYLMSHLVDLAHWFARPQKVRSVYAVGLAREVPESLDMCDAYLELDRGARLRLAADWVQKSTIPWDGYQSFSTSRGLLVHHRSAAYGTLPGVRAYLAEGPTTGEDLARLETLLATRGIRLECSLAQEHFSGESGQRRLVVFDPAAQDPGDPEQDGSPLRHYLASFAEGVREPSTFRGFGPLPGLADGLRQVAVCEAIGRSVAERREVEVDL